MLVKKKKERKRVEGGGEGKKELRCIMYIYRFTIMNVIMMYYKHVLVKIKN